MTLNASDLSDATLTLVFSNRILTPLITGATTGRSPSTKQNEPFLDSSCSSPQTTYQSNYTINHQQLSPTDSHTNLGIVMSADLSWRKHYGLISSCAYRTLGLLRCTFNTTNSVNLKKLLYLSLVCSQLTYCSIIWHPYLHKNILMLEMIQWRATKFILNDYSSDYKSRFTPTAPSGALWAHWHHFLCQIAQLYYQHLQLCFCEHGTRPSTHHKLKLQYVSCTNKTNHFNRLPCLWKSLPIIDLNQPLPTIISELKQFFWNHFIGNYHLPKTCTFHYLCPCYKCSVSHSTMILILGNCDYYLYYYYYFTIQMGAWNGLLRTESGSELRVR